MGLNCVGPIMHILINTVLPYDFCSHKFYLTYFIVKIQYMIHTTHKICVNFILSVRPTVGYLSVVKFLRSQKLYTDSGPRSEGGG